MHHQVKGQPSAISSAASEEPQEPPLKKFVNLDESIGHQEDAQPIRTGWQNRIRKEVMREREQAIDADVAFQTEMSHKRTWTNSS